MEFLDYTMMINGQLGNLNLTHYKKNDKCLISSLCDTYGSDKGSLSPTGHPYPWPAHTYAHHYSELFDHCRNHILNVFECGLGTNNPDLPSSMGIKGKPGASLRVWRDYFPNANIIGIDIDKEILFEENRIKTFRVDQTDKKSIDELWSNIKIQFDIMIDDGLHTFDAGRVLFENSIHKLVNGGIYIIEDVTPQDLLKFKSYFSDFEYSVKYVNLIRPNSNFISDNNLVILRKNLI